MTMALLLHEESAARIQGAFVQSGATLFNFLSTEKARRNYIFKFSISDNFIPKNNLRSFAANEDSINKYITDSFCANFSSCDVDGTIQA